MVWYIGYGLAHILFLVDLCLETSKRKTISRYVRNGPIPSYVFYITSIAAFNATFWLVSPMSAGLALGFWLLGHFSK